MLECRAGDPVRLFHHLGAGVWSFLASPAAGLVEGARGRAPQRLAAGIAAGLRGLLSNTVYGFSNATAKMSGAARKVRISIALLLSCGLRWYYLAHILTGVQIHRGVMVLAFKATSDCFGKQCMELTCMTEVSACLYQQVSLSLSLRTLCTPCGPGTTTTPSWHPCVLHNCTEQFVRAEDMVGLSGAGGAGLGAEGCGGRATARAPAEQYEPEGRCGAAGAGLPGRAPQWPRWYPVGACQVLIALPPALPTARRGQSMWPLFCLT